MTSGPLEHTRQCSGVEMTLVSKTVNANHYYIMNSYFIFDWKTLSSEHNNSEDRTKSTQSSIRIL